MDKNNKIRLLIISDYFYPHWTGISKSIYYLIQNIGSFTKTTVLTISYDNHLLREEGIFGATIIREPSLFTLSRAKYSLSINIKFIKLLSGVDTVLINAPSINILPFVVFAKIARKKTIIFHQGDLILPSGFKNRILEVIFYINSYLAFFFADKVSTYTKDYGENSKLLKNFLKKFTPLILPVLAVAKNPKKTINKKGILFGFAGRFVEEKGFDILFRAIPLICKKIPNAHFVYAGKPMEYEDFFEKNKSLYNSVKNKVEFMGLLNEKEMNKFYEKINFMIIPSRSDCFNLVQAEAMLHGIPCISSNIPGLRVMIQKTGFGILFEKENPVDLAKKVSIALREYNKIINSYQKVKEILNNKKNVKKIKKFIAE